MKILFLDRMWKGGVLSEREVIETLSVHSLACLPYGGFVFYGFVVLSIPLQQIVGLWTKGEVENPNVQERVMNFYF
jgi:hypothetical protein